MNKAEFLKVLEDRLSVLEAQERKDMLSEYSQHIEMKMKSGMGEEEAIDDFGDVDSLIEEILEAYHIDPDYKKKEKGFGENKKSTEGVFAKSKQSISGLLGQKKEKENRKEDHRQDTNTNRKKVVRDMEEGEDKKISRLKARKERRERYRKGTASLASGMGNGMKSIFYLCIKLVLIIIMIPAVIADLFAIFGLGTLLILLIQGYPLVGAGIGMLGIVLCCSSYSIFILTYIIGNKEGKRESSYKNREEVTK